MNEEKLKQIVLRVAGDFGVPSLSVCVSRGAERFSCTSGRSNLEKDIPATDRTVYSIGSSTKTFTAACLAILAGEGKLDLDEPVKTYLPDFQMADPYVTENLTVRDILCHRCGLPRHQLSLTMNKDRSPEETVRAMAALEPAFPFRYRFSYQNHMFILATVLAEKVSGQSWESLLRERIFNPLGMNATYCYASEIPEEAPEKSKPYLLSKGRCVPAERDELRHAAGAGSLYSTPEDMTKWLRFFLYGDENILQEALRRELTSPQMLIRKGEHSDNVFPEISMSAYGLGWFVYDYRGLRLVHHGGTVTGYQSMQLFVPEKELTVSCISNCNSIEAVWSVAYLLMDEVLGLSEIDWPGRWKELVAGMEPDESTFAGQLAFLRQTAEGQSFAPGDYAGTYVSRGYGTLSFLEKDGKPVLPFDGEELAMYYQGNDCFALVSERDGFAVPAFFSRDETGAVCRVGIPLEPELKGKPEIFEKCRGKVDL